jgi:hypothetical protein
MDSLGTDQIRSIWNSGTDLAAWVKASVGGTDRLPTAVRGYRLLIARQTHGACLTTTIAIIPSESTLQVGKTEK